MFKLCVLLFIATLSAFPCPSTAECCYKQLVRFTMKDKDLSCDHFGGSFVGSNFGELIYPNNDFYLDKIRKGRCEIEVCSDGKPVMEGTYCGNGPCNIFGCNCNGGCIKGNGLHNFRDIHGEQVYNVYYPR